MLGEVNRQTGPERERDERERETGSSVQTKDGLYIVQEAENLCTEEASPFQSLLGNGAYSMTSMNITPAK